MSTCPSCGYCPHCKRGGSWTYPSGPIWISQPSYPTIRTGDTANTITVTAHG